MGVPSGGVFWGLAGAAEPLPEGHRSVAQWTTSGSACPAIPTVAGATPDLMAATLLSCDERQ
jgi:hypothetical protein